MNQLNQHEMTVAGTANIDRPAQDILNVDCWEKVYDYLSFEDIYNMGQTCKRLHRIAGLYVQQYFPAVCGEIKTYDTSTIQNGFNEYISELHIRGLPGAMEFNYYLDHYSFLSIKKLTLIQI